jgi:hypothetical protein
MLLKKGAEERTTELECGIRAPSSFYEARGQSHQQAKILATGHSDGYIQPMVSKVMPGNGAVWDRVTDEPFARPS